MWSQQKTPSHPARSAVAASSPRLRRRGRRTWAAQRRSGGFAHAGSIGAGQASPRSPVPQAWSTRCRRSPPWVGLVGTPDNGVRARPCPRAPWPRLAEHRRQDYSIADLRGRFVLLDFWTFCCVNCLHVLDELRPLEEKYADELVVVGVHSPKFVHEADPEALARGGRALRRAPPGARRPRAGDLAGLHRPGLADAGARRPGGLRRRAVRRRGPCARDRRAARRAGRGAPGQGHAAAAATRPYVAPAPSSPATCASRPRRSRLPAGGFLVADAGHHAVVELDADAETVVAGSAPASAACVDGAATARSTSPTACACCPTDVAAEVGYDVVVADTVNHALRGVTLADGRGHARSPATASSGCRAPATDAASSSPWDVAWWRRTGSGSRWPASTSCGRFDPRTGAVEVAAGTDQRGPARRPARARRGSRRPSGLARRRRPALDRRQRDVVAALGRGRASVHTAVGHRASSTSASATARPTRRCSSTRSASPCCPTGRVAVCDTYNGAVRRYDPAAGEVTTLATGLAEPSGARTSTATDSSSWSPRAHRLTRVAARRGRGRHRRLRPHAPSGRSPRSPAAPRARRGLHAAAGPEGRRPVRPAVAAGRSSHPAGAARATATAAAPT